MALGRAKLWIVIPNQIDDPAIFHQHGMAIAQSVFCRDAAIGQGLQHQMVSVTFFRCGGWSGSKPRATAKTAAQR